MMSQIGMALIVAWLIWEWAGWKAEREILRRNRQDWERKRREDEEFRAITREWDQW
jgi:hypothetical protein